VEKLLFALCTTKKSLKSVRTKKKTVSINNNTDKSD
jgi:hypothetical protein